MGDHIREPARKTPIRWRADVIVAGGGPAGFAAALAARRQGADVLLLERHGHLGGLATGGLVVELPSFEADGRPIIGGIGRELRDALIQRGHAAMKGDTGHCFFDPEAMKWLCARLLREAGVRVVHHVWVAGTVTDGGRVTGLLAETKQGRVAAAGDMVIDATGDGDVIASTGCEFDQAHALIGLPWRIAGIDANRAGPALAATLSSFREERAPERGWLAAMPVTTADGSLWCTNGLDVADGLDPEALSELELRGRELAFALVERLRREVPGCGSAYVSDVAPQIGVRHTRRLVGRSRVTDGDARVHDKRYPDAIGRAGGFYQVRSLTDVPYGALVPARGDGLLVAGRCVSADLWALETLRLIHACWVTGQAAGTAAAMCAESGAVPATLPYPDLRARLQAEGVAFAEG
ncbi:MAG: FAD-dependent oxidoreductase [Armatimonadia bacterium]|nr:FAD-dependent oxidoreductase [Armatimonadia bacterium]